MMYMLTKTKYGNLKVKIVSYVNILLNNNEFKECVSNVCEEI